MQVSTVEISFQNDFLDKIDEIAGNEDRTRADLIREAVRLYIDRKKDFDSIFQTGKQIGSTLEIKEPDVMNEIKEYRITKHKIA